MTRQPSLALQVLRQNRLWISRFLAVFMALWQIGQPLQAATFYWDTDTSDTGNAIDGTLLGGTGAWDTATSNWWPVPAGALTTWGNTSSDTAIFSGPTVSIPTLNTATLASGMIANQLRFNRSGYTLTGGNLTLAGTTPTLYASLGESATIASQLSGTAGLTVSGGGSFRLTNALNNYTGTTTISNGSLVISNQAALGADTSAIVVAGSATRGFGGGSLVLDGTSTGLTFTRDLSLQGLGPISDRSSALISVGNNTLTGTVAISQPTSGTNVNTRITSGDGMLNFSSASTLNVLGTAATTLSTLGGTNQTGAVGYNLAGTITGPGTYEKAGAGTLFLNPTNVSGFAGTLRVTSNSVTGTQGTIRITNPNVIGSRVGTGASSIVDLNAGFLELRMNTPSLQTTGGTNANIYSRSNTNATLFVDHGLGGSAVNQTLTLGEFGFAANASTTFASRNGYNITFGAAPVVTGDNSATITNSMAGTLSFTGAFWSNANNTAARTMTIAGNGNTLVSGNITASSAAFDHILTKSGSGSLTVTSTGSTLDGAVNVQGGALRITDFRSITNNTSTISLGNATTTSGNLIIGTGTAATVAGLTTSKPILLNTTTASNSIYANQTGSNPVVLNGAITKITAATTGNLILGGTNTADNIINVPIPVESTPSAGGLVKLGTGTWVLNSASTYAGATTINAGTLKLNATAAASDTIKSAASNTVVFAADATTQSAGGTLQFTGFSGAATTEDLGILTPTLGAGNIIATANGGATTLKFTSLGTRAAGATLGFAPGTLAGIQFGTTAPTGLNGQVGGFAYISSPSGSIDFVATPALNTNLAPLSAATALPAATGSSTTNYINNASLTQTAAVAANTLRIVGSGQTIAQGGFALTVTNTSATAIGGILFDNGTGAATIAGGSIVGSAANEIIVITGGAATGPAVSTNSLTINSTIGAATASGLTKSGAGRLIIGGNNAYTGNNIINEGYLQLTGATATLGVNSTAGNQIQIRQGAILDINAAGVSNTINVGALVGAGTITNSGGGTSTAGTIALGRSTSTTPSTFSGVLQNGAGILNISVDGTSARIQSLLGQSTYTGVTTINTASSITVNTLADGGTASGIGQSSNAASNLVFNGASPTLVYQGNIRDGSLNLGSASASTDRLFTISGAGAVLSSTVSNGNAAVWSNTGAIVHGTNAARTLTLTGTSTGDNTFNPQFTDSVGFVSSLSKTGAGQWNLGSSTSSYTGTTNIAEGILGLNNNSALPANSPLVFSAGATTTVGVLQMSGTFERNLAATATAGAGTVTWGSTSTGGGGFAAHTTPLVVAIGGVTTPTALTWGSGGFVGTGGVQALILSSASALSDVDFRNPIDLGASQRTVTVNDNANTAADYATLSGVLSGAGGLVKNGAGMLKLTGANTYAGVTDVNTGTIIVTSLGNSATPGATSVGNSAVGNTNAGAVTLGNTTTGGATLQYVGPGETSDRKIRFNATTGAPQIHADGSGPLILTNVVNDFATPTGAKTLTLRGSNTANNMITSALTNDAGGGALGVTVDGGATWILTGANTYTGTTTVGAGGFGIASNTLGSGAGFFDMGSGTIFGYQADRVVTNPARLQNNATPAYAGEYSLDFSANPLVNQAAANNTAFTNNIISGKTLTFGAMTSNSMTAGRTLTINGTGDTIISGNITTTTAFDLNFVYSGTGSLTLGGTGNDWSGSATGGNLTVSSGTLKLANSEVIPNGAGNGNLIISPATTVNATFNLNGNSETVNALTASSAGNIVIDNTSATPVTLTVGDNNGAVAIGGGGGSYAITNSGGGALSLTKTGTAAATISTGVTLSYQGATSVNGGSLTVSSAVNGTSGLAVTGTGSLLALNGGITVPTAITSVNVAGGSTLNLLDGSGNKLSALTSLTLGSAGGTNTTLGLNVGDLSVAGDNLNTDTMSLTALGTLTLTAGNKITFNLTDTGLNPRQTYVLLDATNIGGGFTSGALSLSDYLLGATPGGFTSISLSASTNNQILLTTGSLITGSSYWRGLAGGGTDTTWNSNANNWSLDKANTSVAASIPGQGTDVVFQVNAASNAAVSTTLEQNFKINSLTFEADTTPANTPTAITISPGTVTTNRLEIAPQIATDGIKISAGGTPAVTISAPLRLGTTQTWNVADAASVLTLSGGLQGEADVTKAGSGRVSLTAAAASTFNTGLTTDFTISGGTLEATITSALGTTANNNLARLDIASGGTFYYNNATAGTMTNPIKLSGGSLSGGGGNHTYSGTVNVSGNSFINLADSNGPNTNTARNITLSGAVSGSGNLTIDGNNTVASGNQTGGLLTLNNAANSWIGDFLFNRGTALLTSAATPSFTTNDVTFNSFGRLQLQGVNGQTLTRTGNLAYGAGAIGEFSVDNVSATLTSDFLVNQNGAITLGSGGTGGNVRVFLADDSSKVNFSGGMTLGGNSSISVGSAATRLLTISSVINDGGNNYSLAINDDAGGWGVTNGTVRMDAANTYTGGTVLASGTLILGHKDALSTGPLAVTAASTLNSLVDLTGLDARSNALNLSAVLTFTGANSITFNGTTTNIGAGGITNSLTSGNLLFNLVNLAEPAAAAARTLTIAGASTGNTTITTLVNNAQNNILTNNLTPGTLSIGAVALSESAVIGRTLTLTGTGNTVVTGLIEDVAGGSGTAGTLAKAGTGVLTLQGANTFTGPLTIAAGVLEYSTVTNASGGASNLGNGAAISMSGGTLRFIGSASQSTNRPITTTGSATFSANGTGVASITYTGAITQAVDNSFTLAGTDSTTAGFITGGITQPAGAASADLNVSSGNWTLSAGNATIADDLNITGGVLNLQNMVFSLNDDVVVTNSGAILNLNSAGVLTATNVAGTSSGLHARTGGVINLNANDIFGVANSGGLDFINVGDSGPGAVGVFNTNTFNISSPGLLVGNVATGLEGNVTGIGTITVTSTATDYSLGIRTYRGSIGANLAGVASFLKQGLGDVTITGNNSGLTGTVAATRIDSGSLILDYTTQNNNKISAVAGLDMRGGTLTLNGNNSAATSQTVASITLANGGTNAIDLNSGTGQALVLNLGGITRAASAGTLRVFLPTGTQDATNGITTTTAVNAFGTLGGFLTVTDATGTYFAAKSGNNIIPVASTVAADASTWTNGQNVTNTGSSFSGTTGLRSINSLSFDHVTGGTITVANTATLDLFNGGALLTSNVTGGAPTITGGRLTSSIADVIVTHDGAVPLTIASQIGLNNAVTKTGDGTLLINGTINNYTAATQILSGTLQVSGGNAIGNSSSVVLSDDRASTFELLANETIGNLSGGNAASGITFGTVALGANTLTINSAANGTYAGVFTGSGSIVRNGSSGLGNLFFTGNSGSGFTGALVTNGGLMYVEGVATMNASSLTVNKGGSFLISNNGTTRSGTRFLDTMPIILNSADGAWGTETRPSGLSIRTDQNATTNETVGLLSLASGASYFRGDASGTTGVAGIITSDIIRSNSSTINARGRALGATAGDRNFLRIVSGTASETAFAAALVGGGGAAGTKNISILPWGMGEVTTAALADNNMGNSLLTYTVATGSGAGLRPLDFATEYSTFASKTANTDNLRESLAADLTGIVGQTINSLVINNSNTAAGSVNVTGTGAAQTLAVTSGTMLFTAISAVTGTPAIGINLGGFDGGITVGGTNEYVIFVQNPTSAAVGGTVTAAISSPLSSSADITKSGRGTLILSAVNVAGGGTRKTTLNEGILEITDLDNIGGNTGALVFAGGTLRLGSALTDDISTRTISFLNGGGIIDTNSVNLTLANSVGSGVGGLTKAGLGTLTLGAASTYTGTTTVSGGTLAVTANNATGGGGALAIGAGATLDIGTRSIAHNTVTTTGASPNITGTGTISSSGGFNFTHTGDTTINAILAGAGGLFKNQTNVLTLNGANTYIGVTEIQNGTVAVSILANAGTASSLGAPAAGTDASPIRMGLTTATTGLNYIGTTNSGTNRIIAMQGTTGGVTLNGNGTGAVDFSGGAAGYSTGAKTLTLSGTSATTVVNRITGVADGIGTITLAKSGTNLWEVYGTNNTYTGGTQIDDGLLRIGINNALPITTAVRLGVGATAGTLDLNGFDQTIGSLAATTNSNTVTNNILVTTGKTLTINGAVTFGVNADNSDTNVTASGGGSMVVNSGGASIQIGAATGGTNENRVDVDFSGLTNFTANLGAGSLRIGDVSSSSGTAATSTFKLASNNTITAASVRIGDGTGPSDTHVLTLGNGTNVINSDTINIGSAGAGIRSGGSILFDGADTTGALTVRASNGTSRTVVNMINSTGNTAGTMDSILNTAGHTTDILASTLTMANRSIGTGASTSTLTFDQGVLDVTTLNMASRTLTSTGNATAVVNLGDSAAIGIPTTTIGAINMAVNTSAGGTVTADLNVTGGNVSIGTGSGTAINMANAGTGRTVTSTIDLSGGAVSVTGNIIRTGGAGTENATLTLAGSSLNINGNSIGTLAAPVAVVAQSGSLAGLAQLNGGGALTKTTTGTLIMGTGNAYTGATNVSDGTLQVGVSGVGTTGTGLITTVKTGATYANAPIISGSGTLGGSTVIGDIANAANKGILAPGDGNTATSNAKLTITAAGGLTIAAGSQTQLGITAASGTDLTFAASGMTASAYLASLGSTSDASLTTPAAWANQATSSQADFINISNGTGALVLGTNGGGAAAGQGIISIFSNGLNTGTLAAGQIFNLVDWFGAFSGGFSAGVGISTGGIHGDLDLPDLTMTTFGWDTSAFTSHGVIAVIVVPEPSRALLMLIGLLALCVRRRRIQD